MAAGTRVEVEGRELTLTNLDKVLYPEVGFTKGQVIAYYQAIAPILLPHLGGRPLTLKRYPNGVEGHFFYEKSCPQHRPDWVQTAPVYSRSSERVVEFCVVDGLPSLVWVANLASLELHTSLSMGGSEACPTAVVFDLDPGPPATIVECCRVALRLQAVLGELGLRSFAKTSGSKGLQVYVPLNEPDTSYDDTKPFALALGQLLEKESPDEVVTSMRKDIRPGKVLVDWSQNDEHKTTVCAYSLRAKERPTVSTPVTWAEVAEAAAGGDPELLRFECSEVLRRVTELGDLFEPVASLRQSLPRLR